MAYKYLNEPIILYFTLPTSYTGKNVTYTVTDVNKNVVIYTGTIYATGKPQQLSLNDIIDLTTDTYDWFRNDSNVYKPSATIANAPIISDIKITFDGSINYTIIDIVHGYTYPNATGEPKEVNTDGVIETMSNWTGILPRIPKLSNPGVFAPSNDFFSMFTLLYTVTTASRPDAFMHFKLYDVNGNRLRYIKSVETPVKEQHLKCVIGSSEMYNNLVGSASKELGYITANIEDRSGFSTPEIKVANIDNDPADYYIMWINRFGTWQCQPLCSKWELTEKVTTNSITTVYDETIPYQKSSEFNWKLNTHWLNYAEHEEFQSLLTSKYVYLYNTKTHEGHYVTITDSNWTFKNSVNTNKPFNLTLNVTKSIKQNITL